jgi:putative ABC transport system permease protein
VRTLVQDLRFAVRLLWRTPVISLIAILTLALGIGANTAIFSIVHAVVLRPLPYPHSERLVELYTQFRNQGHDRFWFSTPEYLELAEQARSYESIGAYSIAGAPVLGGETPVRAVTAYCSPSLLPTMGQPPALGRFFTADEDVYESPRAVVIGHGLWKRVFGGDPNIIGRTIRIDSSIVHVVGVMPQGFSFPGQGVEMWAPAGMKLDENMRGSHMWNVIGRLRADVTPAAARAELDSLMAGWDGHARHSINPRDHRIALHPLMGEIVGALRSPLWVLQGAVLLVLLIACANISSLLLARAEARSREISIRVALGAGRRRLARQLLTESALLGVLGGTGGLILAAWGLDVMLALVPENAPRMSEVHIDGTVLLFTLIASLATSVVFGLAPIFHMRGPAFQSALATAGTRSTLRQRFRRALVVAEMALAVVLVVGSGLMIRSFARVLDVDVGFDPHRLLTFQIELPEKEYPNNYVATRRWVDLERSISALPGVHAMSVAVGLPPVRQINANDIMFQGKTPPKPGQGPAWNVDFFQTVGDNYFATMKIPIVAGREFLPTDVPEHEHVALINEAFVRRFYPGENPIGQHVVAGGGEPFTIAGVVKDVKQQGIDTPTGTEIYFTMHQIQDGRHRLNRLMSFVVRSEGRQPRALEGSIRRAVAEIDPTLAIAKLATMDELMYDAVAKPRFLTTLLAGLAALALVLAAVGIYGVMSYSVAQRTHELGIRMALGAEPGRVRRLVLGQGLRLAIWGLLLGLGGALTINYVLRQVLAEMLFKVGAFDPSTFAAVTGMMVGVAAAACYAPARRATRVDPMTALRDG